MMQACRTRLDTLSLHDALPISISTSAIAAQPVAAIGPLTVNLGSTRMLPAHPASAGSSLLEATRVSRWVFDSGDNRRSEEHTSELQSRRDLVCRLLLEKKKNQS